MPTHRRCVACRWRPTAATVLASPSATASTPPTRPRPPFGWSTPRAPGTCASAAAATCPRAPSRALLLQERRKPRALTPSPQKPPPSQDFIERAMLWACIHLPQLALDAVLRRTPDPDRPLALVSGPAHLRHLHAVNETAAQAGLKPGMRLSAAHALLSDVALVEHDASADARWQRFLAAWAYRHSWQVSAQWPGAIVLEVRASFRLFGPWPRFEARLREELDGLGFTHRIALAPTPRAALAFAGLRDGFAVPGVEADRKSTRLNSSH